MADEYENIEQEEKLEVKPWVFDDILEIIGGFGRWQKILFVLVSSIAIFTAMNTLAQVFLAGEADHWCRVIAWNEATCTPGGDPEAWECLLEKRNSSIPQSLSNGQVTFEQCKMYQVSEIPFVPGLIPTDYTNATEKCQEWVHDTALYKSTIINEWDLVCDKSTLATFAQSVYFAGLLFGSVFFGSVADWLGRKPTIYISFSLFLLSSIAVTFSPNVISYLCLRFFVAAGGMGAYLVGFILVSEYIDPSNRVFVGISIQFFFAVGLLLLPLLAFLLPYWRYMQFAISMPACYYFLIYFYMPESARWQISKRRYKSAEETIRRIASTNKTRFPEEMFKPEAIKAFQDASVTEMKQTPLGLFKTPNMCLKTLNIMFSWFVISMVYYGLSLSTSDLGVDDYVASVIAAAVEFPALIFCIFSLRYGRRWNLSGTMVLGGIACITTAFLTDPIVRTTIAMIGKFCIASSFAIIYVVSAELYPTPVRSAGMGLSSMSARISGILSPFILELGNLFAPLPYLLFGALSILAGLLALLLPETNNRDLPETLEEGEAFGKPRCLGGGKDADDEKDALQMIKLENIDGVDNNAYATIAK